jgi:hypothetical protein
MGGQLSTRVIRAPQRKPVRSLRIPGLGRIGFTRDAGEGGLFGEGYFSSTLQAIHRDGDGKILDVRELGSGLVTNVGCLALANDFLWLTGQTIQLNLFSVLKNHASGTGATAAAVTDIKLQTPSLNGGQTMVAGVQTMIPGATAGGTLTNTTGTNKFQSVATISYTGTETVTEWGLFGNMGSIGGTALSSATGSPFGAGSTTTTGVTAGGLTASTAGIQGQALTVCENTNVTRVSWGLVLYSPSTSVITVPAWYLTATSAAGTTPVSTDTLVFRPVLWDHRVFTGIGVNSGDSIQFTYQLIPNQGG